MPNREPDPSKPDPERDVPEDEDEKPHDEDDRAKMARRGTGPEPPYQGGRSGNQKR